MCYVIARNNRIEGCVALEIQLGRELVELKKEIYQKVGYEDIELMTISRLSAYEEYAPFRVVETIEEFKQAAYQISCTQSFDSP